MIIDLVILYVCIGIAIAQVGLLSPKVNRGDSDLLVLITFLWPIVVVLFLVLNCITAHKRAWRAIKDSKTRG